MIILILICSFTEFWDQTIIYVYMSKINSLFDEIQQNLRRSCMNMRNIIGKKMIITYSISFIHIQVIIFIIQTVLCKNSRIPFLLNKHIIQCSASLRYKIRRKVLINIKGYIYVFMSKTSLHVFDRRAMLNQHGRMGMP